MTLGIYVEGSYIGDIVERHLEKVNEDRPGSSDSSRFIGGPELIRMSARVRLRSGGVVDLQTEGEDIERPMRITNLRIVKDDHGPGLNGYQFVTVAPSNGRTSPAVVAMRDAFVPLLPSAPSPSWRLSHRWGWPDENGLRGCACGAELDLRIFHSEMDERPCHLHAPALGGSGSAFEDPLNAPQRERERVEAWYDLFCREHGPDMEHVVLDRETTETVRSHGYSAPRIVTAEGHRCRRLGIAWLGQDYTGRPSHWDVAGSADIDIASDVRRFVWSRPDRDAGGIVRLGCELRLIDGVGPKEPEKDKES